MTVTERDRQMAREWLHGEDSAPESAMAAARRGDLAAVESDLLESITLLAARARAEGYAAGITEGIDRSMWELGNVHARTPVIIGREMDEAEEAYASGYEVACDRLRSALNGLREGRALARTEPEGRQE